MFRIFSWINRLFSMSRSGQTASAGPDFDTVLPLDDPNIESLVNMRVQLIEHLELVADCSADAPSARYWRDDFVECASEDWDCLYNETMLFSQPVYSGAEQEALRVYGPLAQQLWWTDMKRFYGKGPAIPYNVFLEMEAGRHLRDAAKIALGAFQKRGVFSYETFLAEGGNVRERSCAD